MVDSNDRERMDELNQILSEYALENIPLLIWANKQDLPNAMKVDEIKQKLKLNRMTHCEWNIVGCSIYDIEGIHEGLNWITNYLDANGADSSLYGKYRKWQCREHETEKRLKREMEENVLRKSILAISGYIRTVVRNHNLMFFVSVEISKLIHLYYQDENERFHQNIKFYGENMENERCIWPDIESLAHVITDIDNKSKMAKNGKNGDDDEAFLVQFENRSYAQWEGHRSFIHVIFCYFQEFGASQEAVRKIRNEWIQFVGSDNDHETKMVYWIHMVRYYYTLYFEFDRKELKNFRLFLLFCDGKSYDELQCELLNAEWWKQFYSEKAMEQNDAYTQFILPDLKCLPQLLLVRKSDGTIPVC